MSHALRVRGLKRRTLQPGAPGTFVARSTRAWIETNNARNVGGFGWSHALRVRGLKRLLLRRLRSVRWSHALRVRGLKPACARLEDTGKGVARSTRAWIETRLHTWRARRIRRRTLYACVD